MTQPQDFDPHRWIGQASLVVDVLLASALGRATLDELYLLGLAEDLSTSFHAQHAATVARIKALVA